MPKAKIVLLAWLVYLSPIAKAYAQQIETYFKNGRVNVSNVSQISFTDFDALFVDHDQSGFYILDIKKQKPVKVRSKDNVSIEKPQFITGVGIVKNNYYFVLEYTPENAAEHVFELGYYDGKNVVMTGLAKTWAEYDAVQVLNQIFPTPDYLYCLIVPSEWLRSSGRLPSVGTRIDGHHVEAVNSDGLPGELGVTGTTYVVAGQLTTAFSPPVFEDGAKGFEYKYVRTRWIKTFETAVASTVGHTTKCGRIFRRLRAGEEELVLSSDRTPDKELFRMQLSQEIFAMDFEHENQLVFAFRENPESSELGAKDGLYLSDGTPKGTRMFTQKPFLDRQFDKRILSWSGYEGITYFVVEGYDRLKKANAFKLWQTDGTNEGTKILFSSDRQIGNVINAKGIPVYSKFIRPGVGQLFKYVVGKEIALTDGKTNAPALIFGESILDLQERYGVAPDGKLLFLSGSYEEGYTVNVADVAPYVAFIRPVCVEDEKPGLIYKNLCGIQMIDDFTQKGLGGVYHRYQMPGMEKMVPICNTKGNSACSVPAVFNFMQRDINFQAPESRIILLDAATNVIGVDTKGIFSPDVADRLNLIGNQISEVRGMIDDIILSMTGKATNGTPVNYQLTNIEPKGIHHCGRYWLAGPGISADTKTRNNFDDLLQWAAKKGGETDPHYNLFWGNFKGNPILTTVEPESFKIVNRTMLGHFLHPGKVSRQVVERNGIVYVETIGEGVTTNEVINYVVAGYFFPQIDQYLAREFNRVRNAVKK